MKTQVSNIRMKNIHDEINVKNYAYKYHQMTCKYTFGLQFNMLWDVSGVQTVSSLS